MRMRSLTMCVTLRVLICAMGIVCRTLCRIRFSFCISCPHVVVVIHDNGFSSRKVQEASPSPARCMLAFWQDSRPTRFLLCNASCLLTVSGLLRLHGALRVSWRCISLPFSVFLKKTNIHVQCLIALCCRQLSFLFVPTLHPHIFNT